jgi:hypothetical protein
MMRGRVEPFIVPIMLSVMPTMVRVMPQVV